MWDFSNGRRVYKSPDEPREDVYGPARKVIVNVRPPEQTAFGWNLFSGGVNIGKKYAFTQFGVSPTHVAFGLPQLFG